MPLTLVDISNYLKRFDEVTLLEILGITSEDIIERFSDFIENKYDKLEEEASREQAGYSAISDSE